MKIKKREYNRLLEAARTLYRLENIWIIVRSYDGNSAQELVRMPLINYALSNVRSSDEPFHIVQYMTGTFDIDFMEVIPAFDRYLEDKYGGTDGSLRTT